MFTIALNDLKFSHIVKNAFIFKIVFDFDIFCSMKPLVFKLEPQNLKSMSMP